MNSKKKNFKEFLRKKEKEGMEGGMCTLFSSLQREYAMALQNFQGRARRSLNLPPHPNFKSDEEKIRWAGRFMFIAFLKSKGGGVKPKIMHFGKGNWGSIGGGQRGPYPLNT